MQPINLYIKDFCGHSETTFSFNDFSSALVIGIVKDNDRFSNGAGKSTIFNAIEYVLFNEIHFSSLEKIIRDGCDLAKVELEFYSSLNKEVYKIIRSNSRKTGTDVRLFRQLDNNWEDLTQRRISDTEKEIVKIIGFNYKAFCASVLFNQSGSENNVQKDFGNLPALTPEKRKSVLREVLQLNVYSNYEKIAKNKYGKISSELEKQKIIISTLGDPTKDIVELEKSHKNISKILEENNNSLNKIKTELSENQLKFSILSEKTSNRLNKISHLESQISENKKQIIKYEEYLNDLNQKVNELPTAADQVKSQINQINDNIKNINIDKDQIIDIQSKLKSLTEVDYGQITQIQILNAKIKEFKKPITDDKVCTHCHQVVSQEHKEKWLISSKQQIIDLENEKSELMKKNKSNLNEKNKLQLELDSSRKLESNKVNLQEKLKYLQSDLTNKRELYSNYSKLIKEHSNLLELKNKELQNLLQELNKEKAQDDEEVLLNVNKFKLLLIKLDKEKVSLEDKIKTNISEQAVIQHKISQSKKNIIKIQELNDSISSLEKSLILHSKVVQAFGSNGIPSLITHSILDELQEECNKWLLKLRPGLQLQFVVINDKNNKEKEDTLDILYFIDGSQREYKQLSGAQKIIVSLSIKLSILFIMNKRLGIDIKLMLLDEVDQALDDGGTEIFSEIIKIIQNDLKILVITHNDELKHKFSHAILVEQDENNVSKGKLINW